jgi:hypothetical protein
MFTIIWLIVTTFLGCSIGVWQHFDPTLSAIVGFVVGLVLRFAMKAVESFGDSISDDSSHSSWFDSGDSGSCGGDSGSCD